MPALCLLAHLCFLPPGQFHHTYFVVCPIDRESRYPFQHVTQSLSGRHSLWNGWQPHHQQAIQLDNPSHPVKELTL